MAQNHGLINSISDLTKYRIDKNYILSEKSPEFLKRNKNLIIKTIQKDPSYINNVATDILQEELEQGIPQKGIIDTALKDGYNNPYGETLPDILSNSKDVLLKYIEIKQNQQPVNQENKPTIDLIYNITSFFNNKLLNEKKVQEKMIDIAINQNYEITQSSPEFFKSNPVLAENYYNKLLNDKNMNIYSNSIITPTLLSDKDFLQKHIALLKKHNIDDNNIINTLTHNEECTNMIKDNAELFQFIFEQVSPENINDFFDKFKTEDIDRILSQKDLLNQKMSLISDLYKYDKSVINTLNGKLLDNKYQNIPFYKMQIIAKNKDFQKELLQLNDFQYILYSKLTESNSLKNKWNRFDKNIVNNMINGYYDELINDLYEQMSNKEQITGDEINKLLFLFQKSDTEYANSFNITTKKELESFETIRDLVCDTILNDPSLSDQNIVMPIEKYLNKVKNSSEVDRIKFALLEKNYNIDIQEAEQITQLFSFDSNNIHTNSTHQENIIKEIQTIKEIVESKDIEKLNQLINSNNMEKSDIISSTYFIEMAKEMYESEYKKVLYNPKSEQKLGEVKYNGKNIDIFEADSDFKMIVKCITPNEDNSNDIWNKLTKDTGNGKEDLRYYTSTSFMTSENLLKDTNQDVILGFGESTKNYSFDGIYTEDAGTPFYGGDEIYYPYKSVYMTPSTLEAYTDINSECGYNEIVMNTVGGNYQHQIQKIQPDFVVYIKDKEDITSDIMWEKTQKTASEFDIPIVMINKQNVRETEKEKIINMSKNLETTQPNSKEYFQFIQKVKHYKMRYGNEDIKAFATEDKINFCKNFIEMQKQKEQKNERQETNLNHKVSFGDKNNILARINELQAKHIIKSGNYIEEYDNSAKHL